MRKIPKLLISLPIKARLNAAFENDSYLGQSQLLLRWPLNNHSNHSEVGVRWFGIALIVLLLSSACAALLLLAAPWVRGKLFACVILGIRVWWTRGHRFIHGCSSVEEVFRVRIGLLQSRWLLRDHLSRLLSPVSACCAPRSTVERRTMLRPSVRVKLMVVVFSKVGQGG